ncbi:hypothetical protein M3205_11960 [Cytobacillus firmus]|uniref:hypothetical protein n=1 Tax=Cytobacillus firmus TaxID=1399 RepID=UPI0020415F61|nr:hypothetical protein [Cytobacillus firmus]MCM3706430.1 hypothetical protein [Cytobacillus firmus]
MAKNNNKNIEKVGIKVAKKWTLANAVKKFTPHQIDSLNKNKGNLNKRQFDSLIKEMKCYYEVVEETGEGKGRDRIIYTDKKRKEKAKKEDGRQFNKGQAPVHSMYLALMVMSKIADVDNKPRTRNAWATYFGIISPAEQDIMNGIFSKEAMKPYKKYMIKLGIFEDGEEEVLQDLAYTLRNVSKGQLFTVLNQAAEDKMGLIRIISSWQGKVKNTDTPVDIATVLAEEINNREDELLKKYGINKSYSLMFKNSPKTKAFNAEWLEYLENVEDAEGNAMELQYIYELFQIEVLRKNVFNEYINAHYPSEANSFNMGDNEQEYHSRLLDYVVENAQKKHDSLIKKFDEKVSKIDEGMQELLWALGMSEEEAAKSIQQQREEDAYMGEKEQSPYMALLESDRYVDCIRKLHVLLHSMSVNECEEVKAESHMNDLLMSQELEHLLGLKNQAGVEKEKRNQKGTLHYNEPSLNAKEQQEELTKKELGKHKDIQAPKDIVQDNLELQCEILEAKQNVESSKHFHGEDEYEVAMADIKDEFREYEEKYGEKAMEHMTLDAVIKELTRVDTAEEIIAEYENKKQRERKEWEKQFEGGHLVKREQTTNNPLEVFHRIRNGRIGKEDS